MKSSMLLSCLFCLHNKDYLQLNTKPVFTFNTATKSAKNIHTNIKNKTNKQTNPPLSDKTKLALRVF